MVGHERYDYIFVFEHFDDYSKDVRRRLSIDKINEMERWLNREIQAQIASRKGISLLNPHKGSGFLSKSKQAERSAFHTPQAKAKIKATVAAVFKACGKKFP